MAKRDPISAQRRFQILQADGFACQYCGARPGNDQLNVAHIIPHSLGGSDHENNLATSCARCNNGIGTLVSVPPSRGTAIRDQNNWLVWKRWGNWDLAWNPVSEQGDLLVALTFVPIDYWIGIERVHERDWESHLSDKPWMRLDRAERRRLAGIGAERAERDPIFQVDVAVLLSREPSADDKERAGIDASYFDSNWGDFLDGIEFARTLVDPERCG